jgi:hypothetical protein
MSRDTTVPGAHNADDPPAPTALRDRVAAHRTPRHDVHPIFSNRFRHGR